MAPRWLPGLELAQRFFHEAVEPLIAEGFPSLAYSAALIGPGSEVLGFDTERSADHHWGPRVLVFVRSDDLARRDELVRFLARRLPPEFQGWSTHWGPPDAIGVRLLAPAVPGQPVAHRVEVASFDEFFAAHLGIDPRGPLADDDWLIPTPQKLRALVSGRVFRDDLGLAALQERLRFYPRSVWCRLMGAQWRTIGQEEPFVGRCGEVGDELGSRLVATRLVEAAMRLAFLQERQYAPYAKWFGTAFARLSSAGALTPLIEATLAATAWPERAAGLQAVVEALARAHNALGLTEPLPEHSAPFFSRPFLVIDGERFADALERVDGGAEGLDVGRRGSAATAED